MLVGFGVNAKIQSDRAEVAAAKEAAEEQAAALKAAKTAALNALTALEKCESAVQVGVTLNDLSDISTDAREEVLAFTRSNSAKLLPRFTKAITEASDAYMHSCNAWLADNEAVMAKYDDAVDKWFTIGSGETPHPKDFKDDSEYQQLWSDAGTALDVARSALTEETTSK